MEDGKYKLYDNGYESEVGSTNDKQVAIDFLTNETFYLHERWKDEFIKIPLKNREVATTEPFYVGFSKDDFLEALEDYLFNKYQDFDEPEVMGEEHYKEIIKDKEFHKKLDDLIEYLDDNYSGGIRGAYTYNWLSLEKLRGEK